MASTLLQHGYLVTVDDQRRVIPDGWVLIEGELITGLGHVGDLPCVEVDEVIDLGGQLTMPGLINAHNHHWGNLFKNTGEGLATEDWLDRVAFRLLRELSVNDLRIGAYVSAFEQLMTGTTCSLNHATNVNDHESIQAIIEPALEVGVRQLMTKELREPRDPPLSHRYPVRPHVRTRAEELALAEEVIDRWQNAKGLVTMGLALETGSGWMLHNTTSDQIIVDGADLARRKNLRISDHCSGGTAEFRQLTGGSELDYLRKLDVLGDNWILVHALGLSASDIDIVADAKASIITNPVSNAYLASGVAPLRALFNADVNVGLGSDGAYVNCSQDMVQQMKFLALLHNVINGDPAFLSAECSIEMATRDNAVALGLEDQIGSLAVGKKADIVAFDLCTPHVGVPNRNIGALVFSAHGTDASTVVVDGVVRVRDGELIFSHVGEVLYEARRRAQEVLERAGLTGRLVPGWCYSDGLAPLTEG